jgi:hypothetical protein
MPNRKAPKGTFWRGDVLRGAPRSAVRTSNGRTASMRTNSATATRHQGTVTAFAAVASSS